MMNCSEARRRLLTDPRRSDEELRAHLGQCPECTGYLARLKLFEARVEQALQVEVGAVPEAAHGMSRTAALSPAAAVGRTAGPSPPAAVGSRRRTSPLSRRWMAVAASLLLACAAAGALWLAAPERSLAAAVVDHMAGEPAAWARTDVPVPRPQLDAVMNASGVRLVADAGLVSYVRSCEFRGHRVPHLVVQTTAGPVTVMVLAFEAVRHDVHFDEHGYRGMIVPVPHHGSIAVLERTPNADLETVDAVAAQVLGALDWRH